MDVLWYVLLIIGSTGSIYLICWFMPSFFEWLGECLSDLWEGIGCSLEATYIIIFEKRFVFSRFLFLLFLLTDLSLISIFFVFLPLWISLTIFFSVFGGLGIIWMIYAYFLTFFDKEIFKYMHLPRIRTQEARINKYYKHHMTVNTTQTQKKPLLHTTVNQKPYSRKKNSPSPKKNIDKVFFKDIIGLEYAKKAITEKIILPFNRPDLYKKYGKKIGGGILLYGLPGTGKTMFAKAVANEIDAHFIAVKCSDVFSKWLGESEGHIKKIFNNARKHSKAIIFFDEFESIGSKRSNDEVSLGQNVTNELLAQMQGIESSKTSLVVIAATNCPWNIDPALLRPGRFDEKIYVPLPDEKSILFLVKENLKKISSNPKIDANALATKLAGSNGADISEFFEKLKMSLIYDEYYNPDKKTAISEKIITDVLKTFKPSVNKQDLLKMNNYYNEN